MTAGFPAGVVAGSWAAWNLARPPLTRLAIGGLLPYASFVLSQAMLLGLTLCAFGRCQLECWRQVWR